MRLLDGAHIPYRVEEYEVDDTHVSGTQVAEQTHMDADMVFKTLVTRGDKTGINVFCIPVNCELNLKKAATASGNKKIEMVPMKDILSLTGYIRGGCCPIGMKKKYPTFLDETAILFDEIAISAGVRGGELILSPHDLCAFVDATLVDLT